MHFSYLSIWIDSKPIVWDSSDNEIVFTKEHVELPFSEKAEHLQWGS